MTMYGPEANRRLAERRGTSQPGVSPPGFRAPQAPEKVAAPRKGAGFRALRFLTSGEDAVNFLSDEVLEKIPGWGKDRHSGTRIVESARKIPLVGDFAAFAADAAMSPLTLATAGLGGPVAAALKGAGPVGRAAAGFISPIAKSGGFGTRVAAETGVATAGKVAGSAAEGAVGHFTEDETARGIANIAGSLAGGLYAAKSLGNAQKYYALTPAEKSGLPVDDPRRKLLDLMSKARSQNIAFTRDIRQEQGERTAKAFRARQGIDNPVESMRVSQRALEGDYGTVPGLKPLGPDLSEPDIAGLWDHITNYAPFKTTSHEFERNSSIRALNQLLTGERVENTDLKRLGNVLGVNLGTPQTGWRAQLDDVLNLPRAVMASMDFSAPFQQGAVAVSRKEWWQAWGPGLKSFYKDEKWVRASHDEVMNRPTALLREKAGVHISPMFESITDNRLHEEAFRSSLAEHLPIIGPVIRRSNYAYTTFLNQLRADMFDNTISKWSKAGGFTEDELTGLGRWINTATGRGNLSNEGIGKMVGDANWLFFSPRRLKAWGETVNPVTYAKADPRVRKEMMRDLAGFLTMGMGALSLMAIAAEGAQRAGFTDAAPAFTLDPRSSDFAKLRVGQTRYNPWAGLQPLMRYGAQVLTGQRVTSTGKVQGIDRLTAAGRFTQSKLAPVPGFVVDWLRGESYLGGEFDTGTAKGLSDQASQRLLPLFMQDFAEAIQEEGLRGALKQAPGITGFGVQTYGDFAQIRNDASMREFNLPWERLTATQKDDIELRYQPQLTAANRDAKEGEYRFFQIKVDEQTRVNERGAADELASGAMDPRTFNARMQDIAAERALLLRGARESAGMESDPDGLITRYLGLREQATTPGGTTDYAILDQLQESFKAGLTDPQDRRIVEDFSTFDHDDSVAWYYDAKKLLRESGYWAEEQKSVARLRGAVDRVAPAARSRDEIEMMARQAPDRITQVRLTSLLARIDGDTKVRREQLRRKDRAVDEALQRVYGAVGINERKTARRRRR